MTTTVLTAQIPERELAIAAFTLRMTDCSRAEISKAFILAELEGYTPDQAREAVLAQRRSPQFSSPVDTHTLSVRVPDDWATRARDRYPDMTPSQFFRYCCHRLTESPDEARKRALYRIGRIPKQAA